MLFLLGDGWLLLGSAVGLLVGTVAHHVVQAQVAARLGDRMAVAAGRANPDPRRHVDPFGVVVMLIANPPVGWGKPVPLQEPRFRSRGRYTAILAAGPLTNLLLAVGFLAAFAASGGRVGDGGFLVGAEPATQLLGVAALVNAGIAVLHCLPLPPLDAARVLWAYAPRTEGWRKARYHLEEQNWGLGILIVLLLPLFASNQGLLLRVVLAVVRPLLEALAPLVGA